MSEPFRCPICHDNRSHFTFVYKLAHEVQLHPETGDPVYEAPELESLLRPDGRPDVDIRCMKCNYTGAEVAFIRAPSRDRARRDQRPPKRRAQA